MSSVNIQFNNAAFLFDLNETVWIAVKSNGKIRRVKGRVENRSVSRGKHLYRIAGGDDRWYDERELKVADEDFEPPRRPKRLYGNEKASGKAQVKDQGTTALLKNAARKPRQVKDEQENLDPQSPIDEPDSPRVDLQKTKLKLEDSDITLQNVPVSDDIADILPAYEAAVSRNIIEDDEASALEILWELKLRALILSIEYYPFSLSNDEASAARRIIKDLAYADAHTIAFIQTVQLSRLERVQSVIERLTGVRWDWWPLPQPRSSPKPDHGYVTWICMCGIQRWEQLPVNVVHGIKRLTELQVSLDKDFTGLVRSRDPGSKQPSEGKPSMPERQPAEDANSGAPSTSSRDHRSNQPASPTTAGAPDIEVAQSGMRPTSRYVFLVVKSANRLQLAEIDCKGLWDNTFFEALRRDYKRKRGWLRYYFSVWRYSGCDFVKLLKYEPDRHDLRGQDVPDSEHTEYTYVPRPPHLAWSMPPITPHMFEDYFYTCFRGDGKGHTNLWHCFRECRQPVRESDRKLMKIPKRDSNIEIDGDEEIEYWGLLAKEECLRAWLFLLYNMLFLAGPAAFWVWWMRTYPEDIQNAAVPTVVALAAIAVLSLLWTMKKEGQIQKTESKKPARESPLLVNQANEKLDSPPLRDPA